MVNAQLFKVCHKNRYCRVELVLYDLIDGAECHSLQVAMKENAMQRHLPDHQKLTQLSI